MDLPFGRFLKLRRFLEDVREEEVKDKFAIAAFIGWQMGAGPGTKFNEYLFTLGLGGNPAPEKVKMTAADAIKKAEGILAKARNKT